MCQVSATGIALPNLQQVWFKYAKLAASMAILAILGVFLAAQAILGVFLAAPGSMIMLVRSSRFIVGSLKLRINGCLQIRRQSSCFSCAFHMRQRFGTKLDVYGCFDSPLNAQIREKPPLNIVFTGKTTTKQSISGRFQKFSFGGEIGHGVVKWRLSQKRERTREHTRENTIDTPGSGV